MPWRLSGRSAEDRLGFGDLFTVLKPFLWPFIVVTIAVGLIAALLSYFLFIWLVKRYRREEGMLQQDGSRRP